MFTTKRYFIFFLFLICACEFLNVLAAPRNEEHSSVRPSKKVNDTTARNQPTKKNSFFRLTATKLIVGILAVILTGLFIYYFFMFYPILCKKERNYDVVEHSRDTTPSPNTEKN